MRYNEGMSKYSHGFTAIELVIAIIFLAAAGTIFLVQKQNIEAIHRDTQRKTAINAMYYNLKEVYYAAHRSYPRTIDASKLKAMDPALFKDPSGNAIGDQKSDYRYEPTGCNEDICSGYTLRTRLEREADYVKSNS